MGGPMNWARLTGRNRLNVNFGPDRSYAASYAEEPTTVPRAVMAGELHRMMWDQLLDAARYAQIAGITDEQAAKVLRAVFNQPEPHCRVCMGMAEGTGQQERRCS